MHLFFKFSFRPKLPVLPTASSPQGQEDKHWLEGFKDTPESVRKTVETIKTHPLVPKDIVVRGFIIDSETGALEEIK